MHKIIFSTLLLGIVFKPSLVSASATFLPSVFQIGDHQEEYEALIETYNRPLIEVCNGDLKSAYSKLFSMFREIEIHAENNDYDIKGVRIWLHIFWKPNGQIRYLAYHLRPNSKNVNIPTLENFLLSFIQQYRFPLISEHPYSLYTSAAFPTYSRRRKEK